MNKLPSSLQIAIEALLESFGLPQLMDAREELTGRYRGCGASQFMTTDAHRISYLVSRMPATYGALISVFEAIEERARFPVRSLLDLGTGPGTGLWAACKFFPQIETATLVEKDSALLGIAKRLAKSSDHPILCSADWQEADLEKGGGWPSHDLVLLSYSINELNPERVASFIDHCWEAANQLLVVVEPGTPAGFERIRRIREQLIKKEAHLVAPCPHHFACPMVGSDWCHFSARIERTSLHRKLKGGSLGYEDEKFSYVVASKTPVALPPSRILREPVRHSGHVTLKLCTLEGIQQPIISKKMGVSYKQARKADWGDSFCEIRSEKTKDS